MKTSAGFIIRVGAVSTMLFWLGGCAGDADCPVCGNDNTTCDSINNDDGNDAVDVNPGDVGFDTTIRLDATDIGDIGDDMDFTDIDLPEVATDATDDAEIDAFFTGTGRIYGSAQFINMDDHSGFEVKLYHNASMPDLLEQPVLATFVTQKNGVYVFNNLPAGLYKVSISHGPMTLQGSRYWGPIKVDEGKTEFIMNLGFTAVGAIDGTVVFKDFWGEIGPAQAVVYTPGRKKLTHPDVDGHFSIEMLPPGQYQFCVGASNMTGKCFNPVAIEGLKVTSLGNIELSVWDQVTRPGVDVTGIIKMFGMTDHSGIEVIYDAGPYQVTTTSDADGNYSFTDVRPGNVELRFNAPEGSGFERDSAYVFYEFYAGTSDVLPAENLVRGYAIWKDDWMWGPPLVPTFSPDSKSILYMRNGCDREGYYCPYDKGLFALDIASKTTTKVTDTVGSFVISPDSSSVIVTHVADYRLLFSVPITGGKKTFLTGDNREFHGFSSDSRFAIYSVFSVYDIDDPDYYVINPAWASEIATGSQHQLCESQFVSVTTDSRFVFCRTDLQTLKVVELDDGSPVYQAELFDKYILGSDQRTLFVCNPDGSAKFVDLETGTETPLADEIDDCQRTLLMPSMNAVIYHSTTNRLMAAPTDGSTPVHLADGDAYPLHATPDSTRVIYGINVENERTIDVYVTDVTGLSLPALLIPGLSGLPEAFTNQFYDQLQRMLVIPNSDAVFVSMYIGGGDYELRRFNLDGSEVIGFGLLCDNSCADNTGRKWRVDEVGGFVYTYTPAKRLETRNMATGQVMFQSNHKFGFGQVASDLSGTAVTSNSVDALLWLSFPELTFTLLTPWGENTSVSTSTSFAISPDNTMLMFNSVFGFETNPPEYGLYYRLMIAPLK